MGKQTGEEVLKNYSWDGESIGLSILWMVVITFVFLVVGYGILRKSLPSYLKVSDRRGCNILMSR